MSNSLGTVKSIFNERAQIIDSAKSMYDEKNIAIARSVAFAIEDNPEMLETAKLRQLAKDNI